MTRSPYAVTSARIVPCPHCNAPIHEHCVRDDGTTRQTAHSARRRAADERRTQEVNPEVMKP